MYFLLYMIDMDGGVLAKSSQVVMQAGRAEAATVLPDLWQICTVEGKLGRYVLDPGQ